MQKHFHFSTFFWVLASGPHTVANGPFLATFPTLAETSSYATDLQLNFPEQFLSRLYYRFLQSTWIQQRYVHNCQLIKTNADNEAIQNASSQWLPNFDTRKLWVVGRSISLTYGIRSIWRLKGKMCEMNSEFVQFWCVCTPNKGPQSHLVASFLPGPRQVTLPPAILLVSALQQVGKFKYLGMVSRMVEGLIHELVKQTQFCVSFIALWELRNGSFQTL